jgi:choline dehydrogenase
LYRSNLTVLVNHQAYKLILDEDQINNVKGSVKGVVIVKDDAANVALAEKSVNGEGIQLMNVFATKEVILSCGVVGTPLVLMQSGIGPKEELAKHQIPLIADLPAVGSHVQDHLIYSFKFRNPSRITYSDSFFTTLSGLCAYTTAKKGFLTSAAVETIAFFNTASTPKRLQTLAPLGKSGSPNFQLHCIAGCFDHRQNSIMLHDNTYKPIDPTVPRAFDLESIHKGRSHHLDAKENNCASIMGILLHPKSRGTIRLKSNKPLSGPEIDPRYLEHPEDLEVLTSGFTDIRKIVRKMETFDPVMVAKEHYDPSIISELRTIWEVKSHTYLGKTAVSQGGSGWTDDEIASSEAYIHEFIRRYAVTLYHPVGSCRMGDPASLSSGDVVKDSVVSCLDLKVHGFSNLRIADASVMPEITSGNTNAPCIMIGEVCADMIKGKWVGGKI